MLGGFFSGTPVMSVACVALVALRRCSVSCTFCVTGTHCTEYKVGIGSREVLEVQDIVVDSKSVGNRGLGATKGTARSSAILEAACAVLVLSYIRRGV